MTGWLVALVASSTAGSPLDDIVEGRDVLPSLAAVQEAAAAAIGAPGPDEVAGWGRRARLRGLVPRFDVVVGTDNDLDVRDSFSDLRSRTTTEGRAFELRFSARWALGDVVFNDAELRANREAVAQWAARRLVLERVTRIYFERVQVLLRSRDQPSPELALRAARLDGLLRALTGGHALVPSQTRP